jgi:hypothetical protein
VLASGFNLFSLGDDGLYVVDALFVLWVTRRCLFE